LWPPDIERTSQRRQYRQNPSKLDGRFAPLQIDKEAHAYAARGGKLCLTQAHRLTFLANDFPYGSRIKHSDFPDRDIIHIFVPMQD
jgi:hypothetical protein